MKNIMEKAELHCLSIDCPERKGGKCNADERMWSKAKVLFLDIDGVVNCETTTQRHRGFIGIDPYMAFLVGNMVDDLGLFVVLSSSWRHFHGDGIKEISKQVCPIVDITP